MEAWSSEQLLKYGIYHALYLSSSDTVDERHFMPGIVHCAHEHQYYPSYGGLHFFYSNITSFLLGQATTGTYVVY